MGWSETRTEEQIQELFTPFGTVEKVKKIGNYSFVHYAERDQALAGIRFEIISVIFFISCRQNLFDIA